MHITVYPKKYAHGFVVLCFVVVIQSFIMNSYEVFIHIHQGCFAGTGAIVRLTQCQWSKPDGYGKISQCITTTKHSKAKTVCIFLGIYCNWKQQKKRHWLRWFYNHFNFGYILGCWWEVLFCQWQISIITENIRFEMGRCMLWFTRYTTQMHSCRKEWCICSVNWG